MRGNPRLLKLPPYLSLLCIIIGVAWVLLLPLNDYSRHTYISENALLPGQVHTYFAGSDQNVFRAFKHEVDALEGENNTRINDQLELFLKSAGLKTARQAFKYTSLGAKYSGENLYAILHAPRGDATEAIVLVGAWMNMNGELNRSGIALLLTLARYFKRWSLWSKDIIFLVTPDSLAGPQAWVDAYHDAHSPHTIASLPLKSGALQGAVVIDYPFNHRFESLHIVYDGVNGQLPNLDLFNTITSIASGQMGIPVSLQEKWKHTDSYEDRLHVMLRGMMRQALGHASGPHSSFIPYHVDAVTLQPFGDGWQDEMAMGRVIESTFRSLNNLLEHLHQSFFFYVLMQANRFVSIGTYLPSAMLVAGSFTIMAIFLWVRSGNPRGSNDKSSADTMLIVSDAKFKALVPTKALEVEERQLFLPLVIVGTAHFAGLMPLYLFNHVPESTLLVTGVLFTLLNLLLPFAISHILTTHFHPTTQHYMLTKSFSLLLLGMVLSSLATLNFSLALLIGLLTAPLLYTTPVGSTTGSIDTASNDAVTLAKALVIILNFIAPPAVVCAASAFWQVSVHAVLREAAYGWNIGGVTTQVVVWCVWWPSWVVGTVVVLGRPAESGMQKQANGLERTKGLEGMDGVEVDRDGDAGVAEQAGPLL